MAFTKKLIKNKKQMKNLLVVLLVTLSFNGFAQQKELVWHTDANKAINLSVQSGKPLFFFFTGSDWCGWCTQLKNAVFSKPEFTAWASKTVVLVELDFPKKTKLDPKIQQQNNMLKNDMRVSGFPTVWFVTPEVKAGKVTLKKLDKLGTSRSVTAKIWIENANKILKKQ